DAGDVAEGASCNVFLVERGRLVTPPLDAGILPGVTRELTLEAAAATGVPSAEERVTVPRLLGADEVFITSTLKEAVPVRAIDGHVVGNGRPGPVTLRVLTAYREYAAGKKR
ncbi:MAG TPA: aminotransferase class IV, partial [Vicinamibacteria bacterium]|nr:aminotransferase class IV [Vicinamibacteria bacterium]